jgi:flagellin
MSKRKDFFMAFSIQTNANSLVAQENLRVNGNFQSQTIRRLTSGYRINQSGDDAAGLAVANKFRSDIAELTQGVRNANDGVSQLQIADGGMSNISKMLDRLKTLAAQSGSATFTGDRTVLNSEFATLVGEIDRQATGIGLNTGGSFAASLSVYLGGGKGSTNAALITNGTVTMDLTKATVDSSSLGLTGLQAGNSSFDLSTAKIVGILGDASNNLTNNTTVFKMYGPGFANGVDVSVNVNPTTVTSIAALVSAINTGIQAAGVTSTGLAAAAITASITANASGKQILSFTSPNTAFQVRAGDLTANALLGNTTTPSGTTGAALSSTLTGRAQGGALTGTPTIYLTVEGAGLASPYSFSVTATNSGGTAAQMTTDIQNAVAADATLKAAGITVTNTGGTLNFVSAFGGTPKVTITGDAANSLGYGSFIGTGEGPSITGGLGYSHGTVAGTTYLDLSLNGGASQRLSVAVALTDTAALTVDAINAAINTAGSGSAWQKAGILASVSGGNVVLTSTNGTNFRLSVSTDGTGNAGLGFVANSTSVMAAYLGNQAPTVGAFTGTDAQGEYQLGTSGTAAPLAFTPIAYATDAQAVTISASDASGGAHSMSVSLNQTNANDLDQAVATINAALQGGTDTTLKQILAVRVNSGAGDKIEFVSSLANFTVSYGATLNSEGINGGAAGSASSTKAGTGGALDISTSAGASAAVTAITSAVSKLGSAQAAVGKGQNQLAYAIGLAQSQISSFSSAESQLRDADIAAEAANLTKASVLQQATMAAMAQANSAPQAVLALLRA